MWPVCLKRKPFVHFGFRSILRTTLSVLYWPEAIFNPPVQCKPSKEELIMLFTKHRLGFKFQVLTYQRSVSQVPESLSCCLQNIDWVSTPRMSVQGLDFLPQMALIMIFGFSKETTLDEVKGLRLTLLLFSNFSR